MQPVSMPVVNNGLIVQRLDACVIHNLDEGSTELRQSQGEVVLVSDRFNIVKHNTRSTCCKKGEAVMMRWDTNEDRNEEIITTSKRVMPSKWNPRGKNMDGGWRLDIGNVEHQCMLC